MRIAFVALLLLAGCENSSPTNSQEDFDTYLIKERLSQLETQAIDQRLHDNSAAYLSPGDTGYTVMRSDLGPLTMQIMDIQPFANGSRVKIRVGNPLAASITSLKMDLEWGTTTDNGVADKKIGSLTGYSPKEAMPAGSWTEFQVDMSRLPPSRFGYVKLSNLSAERITLAP